MTSLADTQALFWRLITEPEGAARALDRLGGGLESVIVGDERLSAVARLDVYGGMYFVRIRDALRENFPALAAALGDDVYGNLVVDYLRAHPSQHFSLREIGGRLESFLREHVLQADAPWAADLAAFEWAFLGAFDAADAEAVGVEALRGVAAEDWAELRLRFSPSLRLIDLGFAIAPSWERVGRDEPFEAPLAKATSYRLWRREHKVFYRTIDATERAALDVAERGSFGEVCAAIADRLGDDAAPAAAFEILSRWINDGVIVAVEREGRSSEPPST